MNGAPYAAPLSSAASSDAARLAEAAQALAEAARAIAAALGAHSVPGRFVAQPAPAHPPALEGASLLEAVNDFLVFKARLGRSDRYLRQLRVSLSSFAQGRARRALSSISRHDLEGWLEESGWKARTQRGYLADVKTLLAWARRRGYCLQNVAEGIELPAPEDRPPCIMRPDQVARLLRFAQREAPDVCRFLALAFFAGVRSAELHRLREDDLGAEFVTVPASKAKTRARRLVEIRPNLAAWLALPGTLRPMSPNTVKAIVRGSGVKWGHNIARHSFVSYHLAAFQSAGRTALEAGHSEAMLFRHYRALVTPAEASEFWAIMP